MKIGLDFGTTNTAVAIKSGDEAVVLPIDQAAADPRVIRTMMYFIRRNLIISNKVPQVRLNTQTFKKDELSYEGSQEILIGQGAANKYQAENKFRKPGIVRKILTGKMVVAGQGADPVPEYYLDVDTGVGRLIHSIKTALKSPGYRGTSVFGEFYTLEDLISIFIKWINKSLRFELDEVVIGRPVYFSYNNQEDKYAQDRLENSLKQAGFNKIKFVYEPVAAAQRYINSTNHKVGKVFVFDFGGGTLDTAIVQADEDSHVLAAEGVYIGGDLLNSDIFEAKIWEYFGSEALWSDGVLPMPIYIYRALNSWYEIGNLNNPDVLQTLENLKYKHSDPEALKRLVYLIQANLGFDIYEAIEKAKIELSFSSTAKIIFENGPIDMKIDITKQEFEDIIKHRVDEVQEVVLRTLEKANLNPSDIDIVVRTGGSSLIPAFENMLEEIFGKEKIKQFETFTSIAAGLALM